MRHPLLHFLLIAGLLYGLQSLRPPPVEPVEFSQADVQQVRIDWRNQTGDWPDASALNAALEHRADDERLIREALRLELEHDDPVIQRRLAQNFELLGLHEARSLADMLEQAKALGMIRSDLVLRRRLIQRMRDHLADHGDAQGSTPVAIDREPAKAYLLEQVWFRPDTPKERIQSAEIALGKGRAPEGLGDPFLLGGQLGPWSRAQITTRLGRDIGNAVPALEPEQWSPPLESAYGTHLVRVLRRMDRDTESPHNQTGLAYQRYEQTQQAVISEALSQLRTRYPLVLPGPVDT